MSKGGIQLKPAERYGLITGWGLFIAGFLIGFSLVDFDSVISLLVLFMGLGVMFIVIPFSRKIDFKLIRRRT